MNILIVAGGYGTRLWPVSRKNQPKQLLPFIGNKTLLQTTYERFLKLNTPKHIYVATALKHAHAVSKQLPGVLKNNYSVEPVLRDRAAAIGLAVLIMDHNEPNSNFVTAWSDHYIKEEATYLQLLRQAERYILQRPDQIISVGITPRSAHTGYGYIKTGAKIPNARLPIFKVNEFKEKPRLQQAKKYFADGKYLWNSGYYICNTKTFLNLYKKHLPAIYKLLMEIKPAIGTKNQQAVINKVYPKMPKVDLEAGLIEKLDTIVVVKANITWADIGSWGSVKDFLSQPNSNLEKGLHIHHNTTGSLVYNYTGKLVATTGLKNIIVVQTDDTLLVMNKENSEDIKHLLKKIEKQKKYKKYL